MNGERLRQLRLASGYTQTALAKRLGLTKQEISSWECETRPMSRVVKMCFELFFENTADDCSL